MASTPSGVSLQQDTLAPVPGGAVLMQTVYLTVNGVLTPYQVQAVMLVDASGNPLDAPYDPRTTLNDIANILKDIRVMMSKLSDLPFADNQENRTDTPGIIVG